MFWCLHKGLWCWVHDEHHSLLTEVTTIATPWREFICCACGGLVREYR